MIFKSFFIDKIQDKIKYFKDEYKINLKLKIKVKQCKYNLLQSKKEKVRYIFGNKNRLGFYAKNGFGMDSQKLYANSSQRITIPRFMLLSYPYMYINPLGTANNQFLPGSLS